MIQRLIHFRLSFRFPLSHPTPHQKPWKTPCKNQKSRTPQARPSPASTPAPALGIRYRAGSLSALVRILFLCNLYPVSGMIVRGLGVSCVYTFFSGVVFRNIFMRLRLLYFGGCGYELYSGLSYTKWKIGRQSIIYRPWT